jgi:hypothetical protein
MKITQKSYNQQKQQLKLNMVAKTTLEAKFTWESNSDSSTSCNHSWKTVSRGHQASSKSRTVKKKKKCKKCGKTTTTTGSSSTY